jgi:NitT/TauT family transport system substrate-binding protein
MKPTRSRFLLGAGALAAGIPTVVRAQAPVPIRVSLLPNDDATSLLYAYEKGLFREAGLDVQLMPASNGGAVAAAVAGGSADIGKATLSSLFDAHLRGIPFTIIAPAGYYEKTGDMRPTGIIVDKSIGASDGAALNNGVIAVSSLNDMGRVSASAWVDHNGGNWRSLKFVELPMTEGAAAIGGGRVLAAECAMPALQVAVDSGTVKFIPMADALGSSYLYTMWFTTRTWSQAQPRAAAAFARVVADAATYANAHHADTAEIVAQYSKLSVDLVNHMTRWPLGTTLTARSIQIPIDAAAKYATIAHSFPAQELIDPNAVVR